MTATTADPGSRWDALRLVLRNRNLRRLELAHAGSTLGDWAYATAIAIWAYGVGGAQLVGVWAAVRLLLVAVFSPFAAVLVDRISRKQAMILSDVARAVLVAAVAVGIGIDAPAVLILVLATVTSVLGPPFRVAQRSLMPRLARRPDELAAANGVTGTIDSLSMFIGPALAAFLLSVASVSTVLLFNAATFVWSIGLILGITVPASAAVRKDPTDSAAAEAVNDAESFAVRTLAGFRYIQQHPDLRALVIGAAAQTFVAGASTVFLIVIAYDVVGGGDGTYGALQAVLGVGCVIGGAIAIARARTGRLGSDFVVGVLLWGLPLLLLGASPTAVAAFVAAALLGLGNPIVDVSFDTLVQRLTPDDVLTRVFGAMEAMYIASMALGSLAMPWLIDALSLRGALTAVGLAVVAVPLILLRRLRALDRGAGPPTHLELWQGVDFLAPLPPLAIEDLALHATTRHVAAGTNVVTEGEDSDCFYVIEAGRVRASSEGRVLREEGPGEYFGEIGLLHHRERTATITALTDTTVQMIDGDEFRAAVLGLRRSQILAENVVNRRLAA